MNVVTVKRLYLKHGYGGIYSYFETLLLKNVSIFETLFLNETKR